MPDLDSEMSLFGGFLQYDGDCVFYLGYPLALTGSERQILLCLMKNHPSPIAAEDFPLRGLALSGDPHGLLRAHISHINRKALAIGGRKLIVCRKNLGYKIANSL